MSILEISNLANQASRARRSGTTGDVAPFPPPPPPAHFLVAPPPAHYLPPRPPRAAPRMHRAQTTDGFMGPFYPRYFYSIAVPSLQKQYPVVVFATKLQRESFKSFSCAMWALRHTLSKEAMYTLAHEFGLVPGIPLI